MNQVFEEFLDKHMIVVVDDILIYSKTKAKHEQHVKIILVKIQEKWSHTMIRICEQVGTNIVMCEHY